MPPMHGWVIVRWICLIGMCPDATLQAGYLGWKISSPSASVRKQCLLLLISHLVPIIQWCCSLFASLANSYECSRQIFDMSVAHYYMLSSEISFPHCADVDADHLRSYQMRLEHCKGKDSGPKYVHCILHV